MTNADIIKGLKAVRTIHNGNYAPFIDGAIKKLDVLDKIRAEIEAKCCITVGRENDAAITLHDVFEIIDKYKAEGSNKE